MCYQHHQMQRNQILQEQVLQYPAQGQCLLVDTLTSCGILHRWNPASTKRNGSVLIHQNHMSQKEVECLKKEMTTLILSIGLLPWRICRILIQQLSVHLSVKITIDKLLPLLLLGQSLVCPSAVPYPRPTTHMA